MLLECLFLTFKDSLEGVADHKLKKILLKQ